MNAPTIAQSFAEAAQSKVPDFAEMSARFELALQQAACRINLLDKPLNGAAAAYNSFSYMPGAGAPTFVNTMHVHAGAPEAERSISRWHEGIHAIHSATVAAAHCSPYNMGNMNLILSPASFVQYINLTERAAMAGTAMLGYLQGEAAFKEALGKEPATFEDFDAAMGANGHNLSSALNRVARECLNKNSNFYMKAWGARQSDESLTLYNYYIWQSLKEYHNANRFIYGDQLEDKPSPIFVRLSDEDIMGIGNVLGVNAFGDGYPDSFFAAKQELMMKHQSWMDGLNMMHGVPDEDHLPTIRQALDVHYGMTPEQFIAHSTAHKHGDDEPALRAIKTSNLVYLSADRS